MQHGRAISVVLIPATLLLFVGCTKTVWVVPEQLQPEEQVKILVTADGQEVRPDRTTLRGDTIYVEAGEEALRFALDDLVHVGVVRQDHLGSLALGLSIAATIIAAWLIVSDQVYKRAW